MKILGVDPGLRYTGWGVITKKGNNISYTASGVISPNVKAEYHNRLEYLHTELLGVIEEYTPDVVAVEQTLVNSNAKTSIKLGEARGVILLAPALKKLKVYEYLPKTIKKTVTGNGNADKTQVQQMIKIILPKANIINQKKDVTDAISIALCHAYLERSINI